MFCLWRVPLLTTPGGHAMPTPEQTRAEEISQWRAWQPRDLHAIMLHLSHPHPAHFAHFAHPAHPAHPYSRCLQIAVPADARDASDSVSERIPGLNQNAIRIKPESSTAAGDARDASDSVSEHLSGSNQDFIRIKHRCRRSS